jgi:hypothetical protein
VVRTRTSDGTHPHWNETLVLSCIKEKDKVIPSKYFDESLDHVVVNVFDDIVTDINMVRGLKNVTSNMTIIAFIIVTIIVRIRGIEIMLKF